MKSGRPQRPGHPLSWLAALAVFWAASSCGGPPAPSLLLITVDTLRADHLQAYGYERATAPRIQQLAENGVVVDDLLAAIPETGPSFASLLTGHWPAELGLRGNGKPLAGDVPTMATILSGAGYRTAAFISGFPLTVKLSGLQRGFDLYDDDLPHPRGRAQRVQRLAPTTTDAALTWLRKQPDGPLFVWVHYYDVHGDYAPGSPYDRLFEDGHRGPQLPLERIPAYQRLGQTTDAASYIRQYDGEIRKVDDQIARLLAYMKESGRLDSTVVAITADHGESLTEHQYFMDHGNELYQPSLHVPLIMAGPGIPADGRRIPGPLRLPDLMPTLLDALKQPPPATISGRSFLPQVVDPASTALPVEALSEARFQPYRALTPGSDVGPKLAVRDDRYTFILRLDGPRLELYDRLADPGEQRNLLRDPSLASRLDATATEMATRLRQRLTSGGGSDPVPSVFAAHVRQRLDRVMASRAP